MSLGCLWSFLKFVLNCSTELQHCKLRGHVYLPCEYIKRNRKTCLSAEQVFIETYFCHWKHICCRLGIFFYRSTLEKCYQISRSGPWYRPRGITFRKINETFWRRPLFLKNVFKIFLIHVDVYKFSFLIPVF